MRVKALVRPGLVCLLSAAAILPASLSLAADYDPPLVVDQAPEYVPVEVGSGWYLRGDVAYDFEKNYQDTSAYVGDDINYTPYFADLDDISHYEDETPFVASVGVGYHWNDFLRGDINVGVLPSDHFGADAVTRDACTGTTTVDRTNYDASGNVVTSTSSSSAPDVTDCQTSVEISTRGYTAMANGYVDLGTYAGLTPFVGAGAGLLYTKTKFRGRATCRDTSETVDGNDGVTGLPYEETTSFECDDDELAGIDKSESDYDLMYSLSAGLAYRLGANTSIDLAYQFSSAPDAKFYTVGDKGINEHEGIDFHQVKVGLRYDLW